MLAICFAVTALAGILAALRRPKNTKLYAKDGFVIVALSWIVMSLFGALPFTLTGTIPNYIDALFETVSGFTTTGASVIPNVEVVPRSLLMWRSFTNWVGGMGVLVFIMAVLPLSGARNMHIMRAESPGPEVSKLVPRVKKTAIILYSIYLGLTLLVFLLLLPDMGVFDALNHAFATAGTGGFGVRADSYASYSPYAQMVTAVFLVIFSINFNSHYLLLRGRLRDSFNLEVRVFLVIVVASTAFITANVLGSGLSDVSTLPDALRHSFFSVSSIISTAGFATADFNLWPAASKTILVMLMLIGACAGSTGGGIKVSRIIILVKGMVNELRFLIHPKQVKKITIDKKPVDGEVVKQVNAFIVTYFLIFGFSVMLLSLDSYAATDGANVMVTNFTAVASAMNNIGPGLEMVGPMGSFAHFSSFSKLVLIFDMLVGRLELFPMLLLFSPLTWRK
jgi:trk system potassium uptake protein TrkH